MNRCATRTLCLLLLALLNTGCGKNRSDRAPGLITDTDGTLLATTDHNVRRVHQNQAAQDLREAAERPAAAVAISVQELPIHGYDRDDFPYWGYPAATVTVRVPEAFPLSDAAIIERVAERFRPKLLPPARTIEQRLLLQVERSDAPSPPVVPEPDPGPEAAGTDYLVQPGDTLAGISAAYYGSTQHWRRILDANPGVDPELEPGTRLIIPPLP